MNRRTDADSTAAVRSAVASALARAVERISDPTPEVSDAVRRRRRARATEISEVATVIGSGRYASFGHRSPTNWLALVTGESIGHCKATVTVATRLRQMPQVAASFADGLLSESALRLLAEAWHCDIADVFARDEALLLQWATALPHADFKLVLDTWRLHADHERAAEEAADRYDRRTLHVSRMLDGMGKLDGVLDPEGLALVREALRALARPTELDTRTSAQRRADALVDMARIALDAVAEPAPSEPAPAGRRHKRNRPKVMATIEYQHLVDGDGGGVIDTNLDRIVVPTEMIRRLACDAGIHRYVTGPLGTVVDHGRQKRTVSDRQFERLHIRDHGCRWPGCGTPAAGCDAHHATHWLDHGETDDDNLVLLCWHHHHTLHEQHWSIEPLGAGHLQLIDPDGRRHLMRPPLAGLTLPTQPLAFAS
jgi:hypothetical protein